MEWFKHFFGNHFSLYDLTLQAVFFGFTEKHLDVSILQNHLLVVLKLYLYKSHSHGFVCLRLFSLKSKRLIALKRSLQGQFK